MHTKSNSIDIPKSQFILSLKSSLIFIFTFSTFFFGLDFDAYGDTTNVMIILDASGSMGGRVEGRTKMDIAKKAIMDVIKTLPKDVRVGLRVYGHQSPKYRKDCKDSRLEVPLDFVDDKRFSNVLRRITFRGYTPLAYSLAQVEKDFIYQGNNVVICVTDGIETCGGDPCVVADSLSKSNMSVVFHVVGFDIGEADRDVLLCIPRNSGGHYFSADNTKELKKALDDLFELSINPGYLKLDFKGLHDREAFIYGKLFIEGKHYMFQNVTTHFFTPLPPGSYNISNFQIKSGIDRNPYSPEKVVIDSVHIQSGDHKVLPLDNFSIVRAHFIFPKEEPEKTTLSFRDHEPQHFIPDRQIESDIELILLRPGKYDFSCTIDGKDYLRTVTLENNTLLPQSYNEITFDFVIKERSFRWLLLALVVPAFILIKFLLKLTGKYKQSVLEEFSKHPDRFKGKVVTLELRLGEKEKGYGKTIAFWDFYPIEITVHIFVPYKFQKLKEYNTKYRIKVKFFCKAGKLDSGNILMSYRRGQKI